MSGDYTKFSYKRHKRYASVLQQQGRPSLDSDWNEAFAILRQRIGAQAIDSFGPFGISQLTNKNAFKIGVLPGPDLSIAPGRVYVDGLEVELFKDEAATYLNQPFYPPTVVPPLPTTGDAVVYLDVWEREVTAIEDPDLLDAALGGVDTTTRLQTVWQVKVKSMAGAKCGVTVGDPPSAGRLTTSAIAPPAPDDPCILPPASGYRGLENRLYRVEVHTPGPIGTAKFKWSRDNGSIVSAVRGIQVAGTQTTLTVDKIGRDQFLRFDVGDWVTVTDDYREFAGEAGDMALVTGTDDLNNLIVLDRALPVGRPFGTNAADLASRHTRVQKWDQTAAVNVVDADGLITVQAAVDIEEGIHLVFDADPVGGAFRIGDYWAFWARTATAQVEALTKAPPRGIIHHYEQLAAATGFPAPKVTDCRPRDMCCCAYVVDVDDDIQEAIDKLPSVGGAICQIGRASCRERV